MKNWDIAIIGAGMSGLTCARILQNIGYSVVVLEKSRGVGGRVATRRIQEQIRVDHGACYFKPKGAVGQKFLNTLLDQGIIEKWQGEYWETLQIGAEINKHPFNGEYIASEGISAIAKYLATDLEILFQKQVVSLNLDSTVWQLQIKDDNSWETISAKSLIIAIPAPQAAILLGTIPPSHLDASVINSVMNTVNGMSYYPCISVMGGYSTLSSPLPTWNSFRFTNDQVLGWIGFDSRKRHNSQQPVFCIQTSAKFAQQNLDIDDLKPLIPTILEQTAQATQLSWLNNPEWVQIHRWRFAFPSYHYSHPALLASSQPLLTLCGDWCHQSTGSLIEDAILSGIAAAQTTNQQLQAYPINDFYL